MSERGRIAVLAAGAVIALGATALGGLQIVDHTSGTVHRVERRDFSADVRLIRIDSDGGPIRITRVPGPAGSLEARLSGTITVPRMSATARDGVLSVSTDCELRLWRCDAVFHLQVPAGVPVESRTGFGDIDATDLAGPATLRTGSGSVRVEGASGALVMSTGSGNVHASGLTASRVEASTGSGNIRVELVRPPDEVEVSTGSGNAEIVLPPGGEAYATDIHTGSGSSRVEVPTDPGGSRRLSASTGSGNVVVRFGQAGGG